MPFEKEPVAPERKKGWPKVLIVEDEPDQSRLAGWVVTEMYPGAEIHTARDANAALEDFSAFHPNLILTDIGLPGPSGLDVLKSIRADDKDVQIIAMTGIADPSLREQALKTGANDYLTKPIDPTIWRSSLTKALGKTPPSSSSKGWTWVG